ncbi:uncharacterized protein [Ptychodera flava]|uniref:uncharacterized protein n=1 Tax=Ptychodera flava TaxID=63121 RepID=UPI00396A19EB
MYHTLSFARFGGDELDQKAYVASFCPVFAILYCYRQSCCEDGRPVTRRMDARRCIFSRKILCKAFLLLSSASFVAAVVLSLSLAEFYVHLRQPPIAFNRYVRSTSRPTVTTPAGRYIMPSFSFRFSGPQNNYKRLKSLLPLVFLQNRSLVLYPIRNHKTQNNASEARNLSETFDIELLKQFVPVVTPHKFFRQCGGKAVVLDFDKGSDILEEIHRDTGLHFQSIELDEGNSTKNLTLSQGLSSVSEYPCVIYRSLAILHYDNDEWKQTAKEASRYLKKAPYVRSMGEEGLRHICKGEQFLAFHWRNRTGEKCMAWGQTDGCTFNRLNLVLESPQLVKVLDNYLKLTRIPCVYLAFPPHAKKMYDILRPHISHLYTKDDLIKTTPSIAAYKDDNYVISLVEQEIVKRALVFIGCQNSAWTQFVKSERTDLNRTTMYLRVFNDIPREVIAIN